MRMSLPSLSRFIALIVLLVSSSGEFRCDGGRVQDVATSKAKVYTGRRNIDEVFIDKEYRDKNNEEM